MMGDDSEMMDVRAWAEAMGEAVTAVERLAAIPVDPHHPGPVMGALEAACDLVRALCERGARWAGADVTEVSSSSDMVQKLLDEARAKVGPRCVSCGDKATPGPYCDACR